MNQAREEREIIATTQPYNAENRVVQRSLRRDEHVQANNIAIEAQ